MACHQWQIRRGTQRGARARATLVVVRDTSAPLLRRPGGFVGAQPRRCAALAKRDEEDAGAVISGTRVVDVPNTWWRRVLRAELERPLHARHPGRVSVACQLVVQSIDRTQRGNRKLSQRS